MSSNLIPRKKGENDFQFTKRLHSEFEKRKSQPQSSKKGRDLREYVKPERRRGELKPRKPRPQTKGISVGASGVKRLYK